MDVLEAGFETPERVRMAMDYIATAIDHRQVKGYTATTSRHAVGGTINKLTEVHDKSEWVELFKNEAQRTVTISISTRIPSLEDSVLMLIPKIGRVKILLQDEEANVHHIEMAILNEPMFVSVMNEMKWWMEEDKK